MIISLPFEAEAAVLAGGASRRMGRDKARLPLGGKLVIERIIETLGTVFSRIRVIANDPTGFGIPVQADLRPGSGALSGVHAAVATARAEVVFVVACDLPFVTSCFVRGLAELLPGHDAVVPWSPKGPDPLCAFYARTCLTAIERALDTGDLRAGGFLDQVRVRRVEGAELARLDPEDLALFNLNTPEDYARAQVKAGSAIRSA